MTEPAREWKGVMSWIKQNGFHEARNWRIWYEDDAAYTLWLCGEDPTAGENALVATLKSSDEAKQLAQRIQNVLDGAPAGQPVACALDGYGWCKLHSSWRCFPNLGEVAGAPVGQVLTREMLDDLKIPHAVIDDCWYSCPKSGECCDHEAEGCNCGADAYNAKIDALLAKLGAAPQVR